MPLPSPCTAASSFKIFASPLESAILVISTPTSRTKLFLVSTSSKFQGPSKSLLTRNPLPSNLKYRGKVTMGNSSGRSEVPRAADVQSGESVRKVQVSNEEWKKKLTPEQYRVARGKGTERPFSGEFNNNKRQGTYYCICCETPLFSSSSKFDSGTGWPSYFETIDENVAQKTDLSIPFMPRTEVLCAVCDCHLGHVFNDGPRPTGLRYCINSVSLSFKPSQK